MGGDFSAGLMILFFTGWVYASLARSRFKIGFWACGGRAVFASVCGVGVTFVGLTLLTALEFRDALMLEPMLFGSLVFLLLTSCFPQ
jgi:hypothetical protein